MGRRREGGGRGRPIVSTNGTRAGRLERIFNRGAYEGIAHGHLCIGGWTTILRGCSGFRGRNTVKSSDGSSISRTWRRNIHLMLVLAFRRSRRCCKSSIL